MDEVRSSLLPPLASATLGELDGELLSVSANDETHTGDVYVRRGGTIFPPIKANTSLSGEGDHSVEEYATDEDDDEYFVRPLLPRIGSAIYSFFYDDELQVLQKAVAGIQSAWAHVFTGNESMLQKPRNLGAVASTGDKERKMCPIVSMSWHPTFPVLAIAQKNGSVAFYNSKNSAWEHQVLQHSDQKGVTSIRWANYSGGKIAVACRYGIFLWVYQPMNANSVPTVHEIIRHPLGKRFEHIAWNNEGSLLAACTAHAQLVYVYDVILSQRSELYCEEPVESLHWSPNGDYLFATTSEGVSIIWETCSWKKEVWEVATSACAWSGDGKMLFVGQQNSTLLFPYIFHESPPSFDAEINVPALDFSEQFLVSLDESATELVGGRPDAVAWDPKGCRIAMTFRPNGNSDSSKQGTPLSELVLIFTVTKEPLLVFTRSGLVRGPSNAGVPLHLSFASNCENGALLSIGWSSGLITFCPFYF